MAKKAIDPHDIPDEADLTQYGESGSDGLQFRSELRIAEGETELSLILGKVDRRAAATLITKCWRSTAAVRHTTAGQLRRRGFLVRHTPSPENRLHVSVWPPMQGREPIEWDNDLAKVFDECFTEPQGGGTRA